MLPYREVKIKLQGLYLYQTYFPRRIFASQLFQSSLRNEDQYKLCKVTTKLQDYKVDHLNGLMLLLHSCHSSCNLCHLYSHFLLQFPNLSSTELLIVCLNLSICTDVLLIQVLEFTLFTLKRNSAVCCLINHKYTCWQCSS